MTTDTLTDASSSWSSLLTSYVFPFLYRGGQLVAAIVAVAAGLLYVQQESLLYYPSLQGIPRHNAQNPRGYRHPGERGIASYTSHVITSQQDGVQIHAWFCPHPSGNKLPTLLFFHGNAGNIGLRLPNVVEMLRHVRAHVLLVEYRGYGDSPGGDAVKPTEAGLKRDAVAAWEYARTDLVAQHPQQVDAGQIMAFGRSLGGAVAFYLAAHAEAVGTPLAGCIAENTFTSISDMVDQVLPWVAPIKRFVLRIGWNSLLLWRDGKIKATPTLFLAGDADALVPHTHMQQLRDAAHLALMPQGLTPAWHVIRGGQHNDSWMHGGRNYWQAMDMFVHQYGGAATKRSNGTTTTTMNGVAATNNAVTSDAAAIPTMSSQFMGMARDAWNGSSTTDKNNKKKE